MACTTPDQLESMGSAIQLEIEASIQPIVLIDWHSSCPTFDARMR
jgi:hypothetical protein